MSIMYTIHIIIRIKTPNRKKIVHKERNVISLPGLCGGVRVP